MFGERTNNTAKEKTWLGMLSMAAGYGNPDWGALVARNFETDLASSHDRMASFRGSIERRAEVTSPQDALDAMDAGLDEMRRAGYTFDSDSNVGCKLNGDPPENLARAVGMGPFATRNLGASRAKLYKATYQSFFASLIKANGVSIADLREEVGGSNGVWATDRESIFQPDGALLASPEETRDRLGLDDSQGFGRDKHMVFFCYPSSRVPDGNLYRPSVLDAGGSAGAAWLPSDPATDPTGFTQHLGSGTRSLPEFLHVAFPAKEISELHVSDKIKTDPSAGYRTVRLAAGATS
jgi:hypothetical protein